MHKTIIMVGAITFCALLVGSAAQAETVDTLWYRGDERCPPPADNGTYSAPYNPQEHQHDYPTFPGSDRPGWSCSYTRADGVIVQYGDSRTPQQQWLAVWADGHHNNND